MRFVPEGIGRMISERALTVQKHSPTILLGAGLASMVGSTVLACRATLKMEEVLESIEKEKSLAHRVKTAVDEGNVPDGVTYTDEELEKDTSIILIQGVVKVAKLYAPAVILGGVGIVCLTKSHMIMKDRNAALAAAYIAIDTAFKQYRSRVVDRYGEETDRDLRYGLEEVEVIDEETGKIEQTMRVGLDEVTGYARWFDETNNNWTNPPFDDYNWSWLRHQQNSANDMLRSRGHIFLNEVYSLCGLTHTSAGAIVGWIYKRENEDGDNYVDFGCWDQQRGEPIEYMNGREGGILLDFNVDGPIWDLLGNKEE